MVHPATVNIVEVLSQLLRALKPIAEVNGLLLHFEAADREFVIPCRPDIIVHDVTDLVCNIISYTLPGNSITVGILKEKEGLQVFITNTGVNLYCVAEVTRNCRHKIVVTGSSENKQTRFHFNLPCNLREERKIIGPEAMPAGNKAIPDFYNEIRKRLRSHFSNADTLVAQLSVMYPKEAAFLQKINAVIVSNMDNVFFDTSVLSREMNMSRTALFRRLKPLIRQPPATYIKSIRLHKAKELLETTDISVGDAAFKTGFQTQSHFSKAFAESFGFLPSSIRRRNKTATNE